MRKRSKVDESIKLWKERHRHAAVEESVRDNDENAEAREARLTRLRVLERELEVLRSLPTSRQDEERLDTGRHAAQSGRSVYSRPL